MMSDHWKLLANILGTPGPAEPVAKEVTKKKPEPVSPEPLAAIAKEAEVAPLPHRDPLAEIVIRNPEPIVPGFRVPEPEPIVEKPARRSAWDSLIGSLGISPAPDPEPITTNPVEVKAVRPSHFEEDSKPEIKPRRNFGSGLVDDARESVPKQRDDRPPRQHKTERSERAPMRGFGDGLVEWDDVTDDDIDISDDFANDELTVAELDDPTTEPRKAAAGVRPSEDEDRPRGRGRRGGSRNRGRDRDDARTDQKGPAIIEEPIAWFDEVDDELDIPVRSEPSRAEPSRSESGRSESGRTGAPRGNVDRSERRPRRDDSPRAERAQEEPRRDSSLREPPKRQDRPSEESASDSHRRGRRGQRQQMSVGDADTPEVFNRGRRDELPRAPEVEFSDDEEDLLSDDLLIDDLAAPSSGAEEDSAGVRESSGRPRRRRGRRGRGGSSADRPMADRPAADRHGADRLPADRVPSSRGSAERKAPVDREPIDDDEFVAELDLDDDVIDSVALDDDHEDDEEAERIRRSRRRGRGRGEPRSRSETTTSGESVALTDKEAGGPPKHRNVPTWLDTIKLLVEPNIERHRRTGPPRPPQGRGGRR